MQNQLSTEESFVRALRDFDTNNPPRDIVTRLKATPSRLVTNHRWTYVGGIAAAASAIAVAAVGLRPSYSLADVALAFDKHDHYTIKCTDRQTSNGVTATEVAYRDGDRWRSEVWWEGKLTLYSVGTPERTMDVAQYPGTLIAEFDGPRKKPEDLITVDALLRKAGKSSVERGVSWNGKKVDKFHVNGVEPWGAFKVAYRQTIVVDPANRLPLEIEMFTDENDCPKDDVFEYDYTTPDSGKFDATAPKGAQVFDLQKLRTALSKGIADQPVGAIIMGRTGIFMALVSDAPPRRNYTPKIDVVGVSHSLNGDVVNMNLMDRRNVAGITFVEQSVDSLNTLAKIRIAGRDWYAVEFFPGMDQAAVDGLRTKSSASGTVSYLKSSISFKNVPLLHCSAQTNLLRGFDWSAGPNWLK